MSRKDQLFLLETGFTDPAFPGQVFYCWHCVLMEGLIASFPQLSRQLDVHRIAWQRPRGDLVTLLGPENQSCPVLVLADGSADSVHARQYAGKRFIDDKDAILIALTERHDIPTPHP